MMDPKEFQKIVYRTKRRCGALPKWAHPEEHWEPRFPGVDSKCLYNDEILRRECSFRGMEYGKPWFWADNDRQRCEACYQNFLDGNGARIPDEVKSEIKDFRTWRAFSGLELACMEMGCSDEQREQLVKLLVEHANREWAPLRPLEEVDAERERERAAKKQQVKDFLSKPH